MLEHDIAYSRLFDGFLSLLPLPAEGVKDAALDMDWELEEKLCTERGLGVDCCCEDVNTADLVDSVVDVCSAGV